MGVGCTQNSTRQACISCALIKAAPAHRCIMNDCFLLHQSAVSTSQCALPNAAQSTQHTLHGPDDLLQPAKENRKKRRTRLATQLALISCARIRLPYIYAFSRFVFCMRKHVYLWGLKRSGRALRHRPSPGVVSDRYDCVRCCDNERYGPPFHASLWPSDT